jgi:Zn finger protein HypA/HybF involved in hydrogenase expression
MAYANCENEDCEKEEWWLQKPPEEYASGGPKCPSCGTTRVRVGEPDTSAEAAQPEPAEPAQRAQQPAQQQEGSQQGGALETQRSALQAGASVGSLVAEMGTGSPEERAETQGKLFTALGSAVASVGQEVAQKRMEGANRAKNADESSIKTVDDYVSCPECDSQITDLPPAGEQFRCPGCGALLESS